jgi:lysophospholipase L1-like esterase
MIPYGTLVIAFLWFGSVLTACLPPLSVHLIGDSTVSTYPANYYPQMGWGQVLDTFFSKQVTVNNQAVSGQSTRSFIGRGHWKALLPALQAGDYLFIQFGHNDQKQDNAEKYATAYGEFQDNLRLFVRVARGKGCHPVLITPVTRRRFRNGRPYSSHEDYPEAVHQVAQELDVPLVDLHARSLDELARRGPEASKELYLWLDSGQYAHFPQGLADDTHFSEYGALQVGAWVVEAIAALDLPLGRYRRPIE